MRPRLSVAYYRRRVMTNARDAIVLGILPVASAGFLVWIFVEYFRSSSATAAVD